MKCSSHQTKCYARAANGECKVLYNTDFGDNDCTFFATREQVDKAREKAKARLISLGRGDLIKKYAGRGEI